MPLPVRFTATAERAIEAALGWWVRNRDKAPHALAEDIAEALALISNYPQIGTRARNARASGVRRLNLSRVRYHLYYRVTGGRSPTIEVLALWHTSRASRVVREARASYLAVRDEARVA